MKKITILLITSLILANHSPISAQKKDTIQVVGHAHMDMNWLWTYSETMQMCNDNLRQVVAFMKEFPDYTMVQSQASVYNFVEMVDPPLLAEIRKYVKEGRLEPVGGMWTEGDMNLSSGEAITRSFLLGQRYFQQKLGKMAKVGWLPDNFGHISQMPQILRLAGCDSYYFHRCKPYVGTFWWVAPDSSRVLCYGNEGYNGDIKNEMKGDIQKFSPEKRRILQITGVGDHGGGPTRANINMVHQLDKTPGYPAVKFATASDFFNRSALEMDGRPTHRGEMQFIFEGCYTSVAGIKEGNRNSENSLFAGEFFNTLRWLNGDKYPADELRTLWHTVNFNEFHDILPGSAINEANKEAVSRYSEVLRKSTELRNNAFRKMADEVKFQSGLGQPIVAYNLQPYGSKKIVEASVFSNEEPATAKIADWGNYYGSKNIKPIDKGQGNVPTVMVRDAAGKIYPAQIVWGKWTPPGYTSKIQFVVDEMPAGGYKTFYVDMSKPGEFNQPIPFSQNTFDTEFFTVKFDLKTGGIVSLFDKRTQKEFVREGGQLNQLRMYLEDKKGGMKSWTLNKIVRQEVVSKVVSVKVVENGPVRACVETVKSWGKSRFIERTMIYRSYPRIDYDMEVHWLETGSDSTDSPMLRAVFPLALDNPKFFSQVPFDVVERPVDGKINGKDAPSWLKSQTDVYGLKPEKTDGQEMPAQKWVDLTDGKVGIALLNKTKYGHSFVKGDLRLTLMRSGGEPDIYPNLGKFNISYSLFPHAGDWKSGVLAEGEDFNVPVYAAEPPSLSLVKTHSTRPEEASFFSIDTKAVTLSGIKQAEEEKELIVRLAEMEGKETTVQLKVPVQVANARRLNIIELPLNIKEQPIISGNSIKIKIRAHEIVTLGILPVLN
ncbi:MAG: glycoside hydrolase family 38 C-terminal domain-containing protein [Prolixibacteraceae bacterium]